MKANKLKPGDLVFTDQSETSVEGRVFSQRGHNLHHHKCLGGTLFCDAASGKVFVYNQVSLGAQETIASKLKLEQEALSEGIQVKAYSSDNGVYTSSQFMK